MKATLEFNLPKDSYDYHLCNKAGNFYSVLATMHEMIHQTLKYQELSEESHAAISKIYDEFNQELQENGIDLYRDLP